MTRRLETSLLLVILSTYFMLALVYNIVNPIWESPDEVGHFGYALSIRRDLALPKLEPGHLGENHQPPLYYALTALWLLPVDFNNTIGQLNSNPSFVHKGQGGRDLNISIHTPEEAAFPYQGWSLGVHLARLNSSLLGVLTLTLTYLVAKEISGSGSLGALLSVAVVAYTPQFLFISASVNNDNLLITSSTAMIWLTVHSLKQLRQRPLSRQDGILIGLVASTVLLSKMLGLAIAGVALATLTVVSWRRWSFRALWDWIMPAALVFVALTGWYWVRNWVLYGDPVGWLTYSETFHMNLRTNPMTGSEWLGLLKTQFQSYWAVFGWMNVYAPRWFYRAVLVLLGAAGVGWLFRAIWRSKSERLDRSVWALPAFFVAHELMMMAIAQRASGTMWQGRYLFPVISVIGISIATGLTGIGSAMATRRTLAIVISSALLALATLLPFTVIAPAYRPPTTLEDVSIPNALSVVFGDELVLRGYDISESTTNVTLKLYWQALTRPGFDYSVFVHVRDSDGEMIGQDDKSPGADQNRPPTAWRDGEVIESVHRVSLLRAPEGDLVIDLGVYNWATGERLTIGNQATSSDVFTIAIRNQGIPPVTIGALILASVLAGGFMIRKALKRTNE